MICLWFLLLIINTSLAKVGINITSPNVTFDVRISDSVNFNEMNVRLIDNRIIYKTSFLSGFRITTTTFIFISTFNKSANLQVTINPDINAEFYLTNTKVVNNT